MNQNIQSTICELNESAKNLSDVSRIVGFITQLNDLLEKNGTKLEFVLDMVLHEETGIWNFLKEIKRSEKPSKVILDSLLNLLETILDLYVDLSAQYIKLFSDFCKSIMLPGVSHEMKDLGYKLLINILNKDKSLYFYDNEAELIKFLDDLYPQLDTNKSTEKQKMFQLIASIVDKYPDIVSKQEKGLSKIARNINYQMKNLLQKETVKISEVEGMIYCIFSLLDKFPEKTHDYHTSYYNHLITILQRDTTKHEACRGVMKIIQYHSDKFADLIKRDYKTWYNILNNYLDSQNKDDFLVAKETLNTFYPNLARMLQEKSEENKQILMEIIELLKCDINGYKKMKIMLAVRNYVHFAKACKAQEDDHSVQEMITHVICMLERSCSNVFILDNNELKDISNLLWSSSKLLSDLNVNELKKEHLKILENATILLISTFPKIPEKEKINCINSVIHTILHIAQMGESHLDNYLEKFIYSGIISSCSHMTESNVEFLKATCEVDDKSILKELISYKDFIMLWEKLLNFKSIACEIPELIRIVHEINIEQKITDNFIKSTLEIIEKLNIKMKKNEQNLQMIPIMVEYDLVPCCEGDYNIFINLVELFFCLFSNTNENFEKWVAILIPKLISYVSRNDIKFGFYQLLTVVFKQCKNQENVNLMQIKAFLANELDHLDELQKTDLKACLPMILNLPDFVVLPLLLQLTPALQAAFDYGLEDLPLAEEALNALKNWYLISSKDDFKPVLIEVIPSLKPFIQSKRFIGETDVITQYEKDLIMPIMANPRSKTNLKFRKSYMQSANSELEKFQVKVVNFVGQVETDIWLPVFSSNSYISWEAVDMLSFDVPFKDMKVKVYLDKILPRVIELINNSSDLKTRIAACEVLHSAVIIFIGNSNHLTNKFPTHAPNLFKKIISTVFALGSDVNDTVQQLFRPLSMQLAHFYSEKLKKSTITNAFLEILFDILTTKNDASLRKFAAELIGESLIWSLKVKDTGVTENSNVAAVIKQIGLFCEQPCSHKKLGAALAFNSVYNELSRHPMILRTYWMELLIHFINNLSSSRKFDCNNKEVVLAIDNLSYAIKENFDMLTNEDDYRKVPKTFSNNSLKYFQFWLFKQCFSFNLTCREKCMEFLAYLIEGQYALNLEDFIGNEQFLRNFKENNLDFNQFENPKCNEEDNLEIVVKEYLKKLIYWMESFSASLHCFWWLIQDEKISCTKYFDKDFRLSSSTDYFIGKMINVNLENYILRNFSNARNAASLIPLYEKQYCLLQEELIFQIFQILSISTAKELLIYHLGVEKNVNLWDIFVRCLFNPYTISLTKSKADLFNVLKNVLSNFQETPFRKQILEKIQNHEYWETCIPQLDESDQACIRSSNPEILIMLDETKVLNEIFESINYEEIVRNIFKQLIFEDNEVKFAKKQTAALLLDFQIFLTFALKKHFKVNTFVDFIFNEDQIQNEGASITHGIYFFKQFKTAILNFAVDYSDDFLRECLNDLNQQKMEILQIYLNYAVEKRVDCSVVFNYWSKLEIWSEDFSSEKILEVSNILKLVISHVESTPDFITRIFLWLDKCLSRDHNSVLIKPLILELALTLVVCKSFNHDAELKKVLRKLLKTNQTCKLSVEDLVLFNKMLNGLQKSVNDTLYMFVIEIATLRCTRSDMENITNTITSIMRGPVEDKLNLLKIPLLVFRNEKFQIDHRIRSIEFFLIPMLQNASQTICEEFFVKEMPKLLNDAKSTIDPAKEKNILIVKIGTMLLLEVYYDVIEDIDNKNVKIAVYPDQSVANSIHKEISSIAKNTSTSNDRAVKQEIDLFRRLKCIAFNTLIKVIRKTRIEKREKVDEFCSYLFKYDNTNNIWKHIIQLSPNLQLKMNLENTKTRRKTIMRKHRQVNGAPGGLTMATECLSVSSLVADVNKFDMNNYHVKAEEQIKSTVDLFAEDLEIDTLNSHENMNALCALIKCTTENDESVRSLDEVPGWMKQLHKALKTTSIKNEKNIVLFILKLIVNCEYAFRTFSPFWFPVLIEVIEKLDEVNYLVIDVIIMLLEWRDKVLPENNVASTAILNVFIDNLDKQVTSFRNYQLEVIKMIIQVWYPYIDVPYAKILDLLKQKEQLETGLKISEYFLCCNVLPYSNLKWFSEILFDKIKKPYDKNICKIFGLMLRVASYNNENVLPDEYEQFRERIVNKMRELNVTTRVKTFDYFILLEHLIKAYPNFLQVYITFLLHKFRQLQGEYKTKCLKLLLVNIPQLGNDTFSIMMENEFEYCLTDSDYSLVQSSLNFIKSLTVQIQICHLEKLFPNFWRLSDHDSPDCRSLVYDIVDLIYEKYENDENERNVNIKNQCRAILLRGLFDTDAELQKKIYTSLKTRFNLKNELSERFLTIINKMYSPLNESKFVSYAVDYLLDASSNTDDFQEKIFSNPLSQCMFEDYKIISSWRTKHSSLAPVFPNSLQVQVATLYSQNAQISTLSLQIDDTKVSTQSSTISIQPVVGTMPKTQYFSNKMHPLSRNMPQKSSDNDGPEKKLDPVSTDINKLKRRVYLNPSETSYSHSIRQAKKNERRFEILTDRSTRRDKNLELKRTYRRGDFPDIQIPKKDVIVPLQILAKRDSVIAKQLFAYLFAGMVNKVENKTTYLNSVNECFNSILKSSCQRDSTCLEAIFEIAYSLPEYLRLDLQYLVLASNMSGFLSLKALLLENSLIVQLNEDGPSCSKKSRTNYDQSTDSLWIQLAEVYKSLDKYDIVNGILKEKITHNVCQPLKIGLQYETAGEWEKAFSLYKKELVGMENITSSSENQKFILDAYYKCSAHLSNWAEMNSAIKSKFNIDDIAEDTWHREYTLPWLFLSEAYCIFKDVFIDPEKDNFKLKVIEFVKKEDQNKLIYDLAEPLSLLLYSYGNLPQALSIVQEGLKLIVDEFNFTDSSFEKFLKLQTLSEISNTLPKVNNPNTPLNEICDLIKIWERSESNNNFLTWWDRRMVYRSYFAYQFNKNLDTDSDGMDNYNSEVQNLLREYLLKSTLKFCEKALEKENFLLAAKYTIKAQTLERIYDNVPSHWKSELDLNLGKVYLFKASKLDDLDCFLEAITYINKVDLSDVRLCFESLMLKCNLIELTKNKSHISWPIDRIMIIPSNIINPEDFENVTSDVIYDTYRQAIDIAEVNHFSDSQISSTYLLLAKHCRECLTGTDSQNELLLEKQIVNSILKAMKYNSKEACQLFPVLLQLNNTKNTEFRDVFVTECSKIEEWKFLSWINQILVYLDTDLIFILKDLALKIAEAYPNALQFPFMLSQESYKNYETKEVAKKIKSKLSKTEDVSNFINAISFVYEPNKLWENYSAELKIAITSEGRSELRQIYLNFKQTLKFSGKYWSHCIHFIDSSIDFLEKNEHYQNVLSKKLIDYGNTIERKKLIHDETELSSYSDWLTDLPCSNEIEIPGQYSGLSIPNPERHVKIFAFHNEVAVMHSQQVPRKITIIGDNAKDYSYLVKCNEDIRQDQRIQQLFCIMNNALDNNYEGSHRYHINTYGVYPLKKNLGMIEWVADTIPLTDFRHYYLPEEARTNQLKKYEELRKLYSTTLYNDYGPAENFHTIYNNAVKKCNEIKIKTNFRNVLKQVPDAVFKKSLLALSNTPHSFWCLRNQFITSYSTMSICSWILGIGDRHLGNILVCLKSGTCIGIDFGCAFGTGADHLRIPELIPFRMTPQITSIMAPFYLTGLIRETMISVLQTVRVNDYILLSTTPIFIQDPSVDWLKYAKKSSKVFNIKYIENDSYFENKINNVKFKLHGHNPMMILCQELKSNPNIVDYRDVYEKFVKVVSNELPERNLKTEEQVDCLLGLATDERILGTSWNGLETWV